MHPLTITETYTDGTQVSFHREYRYKWYRNLVAWWYSLSTDKYMGESPVIEDIKIELI